MTADLFQVYRDKKVLVTGHTGFKGGWLSQWLLSLGADVYGIALPPLGEISLFDQLHLEKQLHHSICDIRESESLKKKLGEIRPDVIFHLAAQPLVRESYKIPLETVETNVMGTLHILEAVRTLKLATTIVVITSDKSYENREWLFGYRENDPMGGYDPYSASKGACEVLTASWRRSFFNPADYAKHGVKLATARAGNVIGGGDWAADRIVPDCMRALLNEKPIDVRNPWATRPWQHVLEPLGGYLLLGEKLLNSSDTSELETYCDAFNFGPLIGSNKTVESLVSELIHEWGTGTWTFEKQHAVHEASLLNLTIDKAYQLLGWYPVWDFRKTIKRTVEWYRIYKEDPDQIPNLTLQQITDYSDTFISTK
ncbi:MAG: CDP-glucose 4,6-dehydratase [Bacteroidales bacterium]